MAEQMSTPRGRMFKAKYLSEYNPYNPTDELMNAIKNTFMPKSGYLNKNTRGKSIQDLDLDQLEWVAFELENGSEKIRFLAKLLFFVSIAKGDDFNRVDIEKEMKLIFKDDSISILVNISKYFDGEILAKEEESNEHVDDWES